MKGGKRVVRMTSDQRKLVVRLLTEEPDLSMPMIAIRTGVGYQKVKEINHKEDIRKFPSRGNK